MVPCCLETIKVNRPSSLKEGIKRKNKMHRNVLANLDYIYLIIKISCNMMLFVSASSPLEYGTKHLLDQ